MDIQKYFNKGPVKWYAVGWNDMIWRISDTYVEGSMPFQTETYEDARERPNVIAETKELLTICHASKTQGNFELLFLKAILSPRLKAHYNYCEVMKGKILESYRRWPTSKIIKDAIKVLNIPETPEPVVKGVLQCV